MVTARALKILSLIAVIALVTAYLSSPVSAASPDTSHSGHSTTPTTPATTTPPDLDTFQPPTPANPSGNQAAGITTHQQSVFTDIANHWARADIEALRAQGVINGTGAGRFDPDRPITKAELIKMLVTVAKVPSGSTSPKTGFDLSKVNAKAWYYPYVMSAISAGIVSPTDGKLEPDGATTREQFAAMAVRTTGKGSFATTAGAVASAAGYKDYQQISAWARGYVGLAKELGLMQGFGGMIIPKAPVTRAEAATMIMRLIKLDQTPATVRVAGRGTNSISLVFSEPVDRESAETRSNYEVIGLQVTAAKLQIDAKTVVLTTTAQTPGKEYPVKVKNVRDTAWNVIAPASLSLSLPAGPVPGKPIYKDARHVQIPFDKELAPKSTVMVKVVNKATGKAFGNPYGVEVVGKTLTLMLSADMAPGATYTISLAGVRDKAGAEMAPATLTFSVSSALAPPDVTNVSVTGSNTFVVQFSKPLRDAGTYSAPGFVSATPEFADTGKARVRVTVTTNEAGGDLADQVAYPVSIRGVVGADGTSMPDKTVQVRHVREKAAPTVQSVKALGPAAVELLFSEPVEDWSARSLGNYTLVRENTAFFFTWSATRSATLSTDGRTLRLYLEDGVEFTSGARYVLSASGVRDLAGNTMQTVHRTFVYTADQTVAPLPVAVDAEFSRIRGGNTVQLVFTRQVDGTTARNAANYVITAADDLSAGIKVDSAEIAATDITGRTVNLLTGPITSDIRLTVRNIKDTSGTTMVPTVLSLQREANWYAVTAVRSFNDRVELTLSEATVETPDVRIYRSGTPEPGTPAAGVTLADDGRTVVVPFDFAAQGTNGFGRPYTVRVAGYDLSPTAWTFTPSRDTTAPAVSSVGGVTGLDRDKVAVRFTEEVTLLPNSVTIGALVLTPVTHGPASAWVFAIPDVDGANGTQDYFPTGSSQTLNIAANSVRDRNGLSLAGAFQRSFTIVADQTRPVVESATATGPNTVKVIFSEPVTVNAGSFGVAKVGTALPVTVLTTDQTSPDEVTLTLDLGPAAAQQEYYLSTTSQIWDEAVTPNSALPANVRFRMPKLETRLPAMIYLSQDTSTSRVETIVTDNPAGQQDRIQGEAGAVEANAWVMVYVDGALKAVVKATSTGAFGPVSVGDHDLPREVRIVAVDGDGNVGETSTVVAFSR